MPPADAPGFCKEICRFQRPKSGAVNAKTKSILAFTIYDKRYLTKIGDGNYTSLKLKPTIHTNQVGIVAKPDQGLCFILRRVFYRFMRRKRS